MYIYIRIICTETAFPLPPHVPVLSVAVQQCFLFFLVLLHHDIRYRMEKALSHKMGTVEIQAWQTLINLMAHPVHRLLCILSSFSTENKKIIRSIACTK